MLQNKTNDETIKHQSYLIERKEEPAIESIEIDMGNGTKEIIPLPQECNPREIARSFGEKHCLNDKDQEMLAKRMELAIEEDKKNHHKKDDEILQSNVENISDDEQHNIDNEIDNVKSIPSLPAKVPNRFLSGEIDASDRWETVVEKNLRDKQLSQTKSTGKKYNKFSLCSSLMLQSQSSPAHISIPESI